MGSNEKEETYVDLINNPISSRKPFINKIIDVGSQESGGGIIYSLTKTTPSRTTVTTTSITTTSYTTTTLTTTTTTTSTTTTSTSTTTTITSTITSRIKTPTSTMRDIYSTSLFVTPFYFLENHKIQEIDLSSEVEPISPLHQEKFSNFMNNFGEKIKTTLLTQGNDGFHKSKPNNDKYFALFQDFQDYKLKLTAKPMHLNTYSSTTSTTYVTTTRTSSTSFTLTTSTPTTLTTTRKQNLTKSLIRF